MFKITPVQDLITAQAYADECGINLKEGSFLYGMTDVESGNLMAVSEFEILENYGYILNLKTVPSLDDFEALFILGRQTMNFIDLCGINICKANSESIDVSMLKALGFKAIDGVYSCNTEGMFDGSHCSGHSREK